MNGIFRGPQQSSPSGQFFAQNGHANEIEREKACSLFELAGKKFAQVPGSAHSTRPRPVLAGGARSTGGAKLWVRSIVAPRESYLRPLAPLLADIETANDVEISLRIHLFQVIQQATTATHHHQQTPPARL
jgi:hypothetical protein